MARRIVDVSEIDLDQILPAILDYRARLLFHKNTRNTWNENKRTGRFKKVHPPKEYPLLNLNMRVKEEDQAIYPLMERQRWVNEGRQKIREFLWSYKIDDATVLQGSVIRLHIFGLLLLASQCPPAIGRVIEEDEFGNVTEREAGWTQETIDALASVAEVIRYSLGNSGIEFSIISGSLSTPYSATSPLEVDPVAPVVRVKKSGNEHPLTDKQWRILKLLNEIPGRVLSSSDLGKLDEELEGSKCYRMVAGLPEEVKKHIGRDRGKGMRILCGVSSA